METIFRVSPFSVPNVSTGFSRQKSGVVRRTNQRPNQTGDLEEIWKTNLKIY